MSLPLVSILIPTYNQRADFLTECLRSAINQTYKNIEIIVSDNHSGEETVRILNEFPKDKIRIIKPPQHVDIIDNFNIAGDAAAGEYITFLSSDDVLSPECISKVVQPLIENSNLVFSYCENAIIDESGTRKSLVRKLRLPSGIYSKKKIAYRLYNYSDYWIIGGVMRREQFNKVRFVKKIRAADWVLAMQLLKYGDFAYCNEPLSAIRFHERLGNDKQAYAEAHVLHNLQRASRHEIIIKDKELLAAIGIPEQQARSYRNKELLGSVIVLVRQYHKREINKETITKIFEAYKQNCSGFHFNFLTRYYTAKLALLYTYGLGFINRIGKLFSRRR
jgi:glycosyltransferase involved in cell wall biosynthesis